MVGNANDTFPQLRTTHSASGTNPSAPRPISVIYVSKSKAPHLLLSPQSLYPCSPKSLTRQVRLSLSVFVVGRKISCGLMIKATVGQKRLHRTSRLEIETRMCMLPNVIGLLKDAQAPLRIILTPCKLRMGDFFNSAKRNELL